MINFNKTALVLLVSTGCALAAAAPSQAQAPVTFASITGAGTGISSVFTYTTGANGGFSITPGSQFIASFPSTFTTNAPATVTFTGLNNVGTVVNTGSSSYSQALSGGTFDIEAGGTKLLSGTFDGGNLLDGTTGSISPTLRNTLTNVVYTGGTYFTQSGLLNPGSFSISMTSAVPALGVSDNYFNSFTSGGTGTFSATSAPAAVPEPATIVPFVLGGLGLLVLAARKTRRTASMTA